jgi:hypothetical protein
MPYARIQKPNALLTPEGRGRMVACVLDQYWTTGATTDRFQVDVKTVGEWSDRFLAECDAGLQDRSSRPHRSPNRTKVSLCERCYCAAGTLGAPTTSHTKSSMKSGALYSAVAVMRQLRQISAVRRRRSKTGQKRRGGFQSTLQRGRIG